MLFPLTLLAILRLLPIWDVPAWGVSWYTRLIHYYVMSFASFMALIMALFTSSGLRGEAKPRTLFLTLAFGAVAALLLLTGISTPEVLIPGMMNELFRWSQRLALPVGAIYFAIASLQWGELQEKKMMTRWRGFILFNFLLYGLFVFCTVWFAVPLQQLADTPLDDLFKSSLGAVTIGLLLWAARQNWLVGKPVEKRLAVALVLLAEAQLCLVMGEWGRISWYLYNPLTLAGITVAVSAVLSTFEATRDIQLAHYFAVLGSILMIGLSLVSGELGIRWIPNVSRTSIVSLALIQGALSFIILYFIVLHLDKVITERTLALHQEQRLRTELTQIIVHDLKNPLTVITSGVNLLRKERVGTITPQQGKLLADLERAGQDTLRLINDMLDVARMEAGTLPLKIGRLDMNKLLKERAAELQILASNYKQNLILSLPDSLPTIEADKELLHRVVSNILSNAVKFTPEEGQIRISAGCQGQDVTIIFEDSGPGIPVEDRQRIFEKFGQVKGTERRGAGLGLTFCEMAVEAHNGRIEVGDSAMLGGALFQVTLPVKQENKLPHQSQ